VPIKKSVTQDYIICLEDGRKYKSIKRHILNAYGLTPAEYRAKWGLPSDYPMVAPGYSAMRSALAKELGLGFDRPPQARRAVGRRARTR
jgi:predicted transcriptional regulator